MFKKSDKKLQINISTLKGSLILPSIILSLGILLLYNPVWDTRINSFNRTLGNGVLQGVDITKRINHIIFFNFLLVPATIFLVYFIISILCKNINNKNNDNVNFINIISIISLPAMIFAHINKFSNKDFLGIEIIFPCALIVLGIIFLVINEKKIELNFDVFKWCIFATIPITLFVMLIFWRLGIIISVNKSSFLGKALDTGLNSALNNVLNTGLLAMVFFILVIIIFISVTLCYNRINFLALKKAYTFVMIAPIVVSVFLELTNILNQYSIFLNSKFKITFIIYFVLGVIFIGYYLFLSSRKISSEDFCFEKYYYPILLTGFAFISVQLPLKNTFQTDFFEQSNHGTAISEFFNFGKIPIIQTFDAHMLQNQIGNVLYGLINNDHQGAIFLGYSLLPVFIILYYFLFNKFFDRDIAFFLMLLFPITLENTFKLFSLAPIVILAFLYAYKTKKYRGFLIYWGSVAITCIFGLDMGFAITSATITTWLIMWFLNKNAVSIKKLILSCLYVAFFFAGTFLLLCLLKGVSPVGRLIEFLNLCESNANWGYSSIGNSAMTAFAVCYFIVPSVTAIMIIILVLKKRKNKDLISENKFIITLIIGLLCIFNLSRGIVRHSLVENKNMYIISSAPLFISMFIYIFKEKSKLLYFVISNVAIMIVLGLTINLNSIFPRPFINSAISRYLTFEPYRTQSFEKTERAVVSDEMKNLYMPLKEVLDKTLLPDETFIDFTNQTLLYALTGREKPMYVDQSPGLLSGEYTQQRFIDQCEQMSKKTPFVLMPIDSTMLLSTNLDGIQNLYRYYLVSEYISNNFKPLFRTSKFAVWCRKDRFDEKANLVSRLMADNKKSYSEVSLSEECTKILNGHSESLSVENKELILKSNNVDPFLVGIDKLMKLREISSDVSYINISIEYDSDKQGAFELFYTTDNGENFNPQKVVSKNMPKTGVFEATIPYTKNTQIRFDTPENSTIKIKNIKFKEIKDLNLEEIEPIDYNYMPIDYHSYDLVDIPYIWANYDKIGIDQKQEQININKNTSIYSFSSIDKSHGNYLFINASSSNDGKMIVQLGKEDKNEFSPLIKFDFSLKRGNNTNYLIRLSSDFIWYSNEINSIRINSDNNSNINKISILKGDTLK